MIDPIAQKATEAFTHDKRTAELIEELAPEHAEALRNLWLGGDPPPITAEEHALFLSLIARAQAETMKAQAEELAEELAEQGSRLAELEKPALAELVAAQAEELAEQGRRISELEKPPPAAATRRPSKSGKGKSGS